MKHPYLIRLAAYGFRTSMAALAIGIVTVLAFGSPGTLKTSLRKSSAYDVAAKVVAQKASNAVATQLGQQTDQQAVDKTAAAAITSQSLQQSAEQNIDNVYDWMDGKTAEPEVRIDLSPYINTFTNNLGNQAVQHTQSLPVCTTQQARQLAASAQEGGLDVLDLPCLPPGVDVGSAKDAAISQAVQSDDFLRNPVLTTDSLPKDSQGKTVIDRMHYLPASYQWTMRTPWIAGAVALACVGLVLWLVQPMWRAGVRRLAGSLIGVGITLTVLAGFSRLSVMFLTRPGGLGEKLAGGDFREVILTFVISLEKAFDIRLLLFGVGYIVIGCLAFVILRFLRASVENGWS